MSNRTNFRAQQKSCWPLTFWYSEKESHRYLFEVIAGTPDTTDQIWINHLSLCTDCAKVCVGRIPLWLPPTSVVWNAACAFLSTTFSFFSVFLFSGSLKTFRLIDVAFPFLVSSVLEPFALVAPCFRRSRYSFDANAKMTVCPRILRRPAELSDTQK